ncbi:mitochondrial metalloendopeptidase OMA1-like [Silene latifolia]|uniref:mitochondrial metalloendopeptidase OMA1-like n=1 Tax=Silene latifolia TaxID=37657 RepID=UPI003D783EB2
MTKFPKTSCVALAMCLFLRVERVPFSGRRHLVIRSPKHISIFRTRMFTDFMLKCLLFEENATVLPSTHVKTLRFESIARKVGQGMHDVLGVKQDFKVVAYETGVDSESNPGFTAGRQTSYNTPKRWWSSNKGFIRGYSTRNLEGREWKVNVIDSPEIFASYPGFGNIHICTGLLDNASDEEVAFVIGHEMGHGVGEHTMEKLMWYLPETIIIAMAIIISTSLSPHGFNYQRNDEIREFVKNGRLRRLEYEADHIGMMLMASAGYDPQAALMFMSKYASSHDDSPSPYTHPTGRERITYLKSPKRMNKAMKLYKEVTSS